MISARLGIFGYFDRLSMIRIICRLMRLCKLRRICICRPMAIRFCLQNYLGCYPSKCSRDQLNFLPKALAHQMPYYKKSLFIFRRDLRLFDNTGLNAALARSEQVLSAFIFDPRQIEPHPYPQGIDSASKRSLAIIRRRSSIMPSAANRPKRCFSIFTNPEI